jgi:hypothetical protein
MALEVWDPKKCKQTVKMEKCSLSQWNRWVATNIYTDCTLTMPRASMIFLICFSNCTRESFPSLSTHRAHDPLSSSQVRVLYPTTCVLLLFLSIFYARAFSTHSFTFFFSFVSLAHLWVSTFSKKVLDLPFFLMLEGNQVNQGK